MFSFPDLGDNTGESVALYDGVHHLLDPQLAPLHQPVQTTGQHITQQVRALPQQAIFHTMTECSSAGQSPATTFNLSHHDRLFLSRSEPCHNNQSFTLWPTVPQQVPALPLCEAHPLYCFVNNFGYLYFLPPNPCTLRNIQY